MALVLSMSWNSVISGRPGMMIPKRGCTAAIFEEILTRMEEIDEIIRDEAIGMKFKRLAASLAIQETI
jgi:hypothetical protein